MTEDLVERRRVRQELLSHDEFWKDSARDLIYLDIKDILYQRFVECMATKPPDSPDRPREDFNKAVLKALIDIVEEYVRDI
jgi:hypothetical protein